MSPVTSYRDYRYSYTPSYSSQTQRSEVVSLPVALQMVLDGRTDAMSVFRQSSQGLQSLIDKASCVSFGKEFNYLTNDQQKMVFSAFLVAFQNTGKRTGSVPASGSGQTAVRPKKWWQFWRWLSWRH